MTRSNKKAYRGDHIDRISDLPSNVIDGILEHLDILDVVSTSILSRKWRYMWNSVPKLEFKQNFFEKCDSLDLDEDEISRIITEVLLLHNGPVYKFTLCIPDDTSSGVRIGSLNKWILFLSRSGIKYLDLTDQVGSWKMSSHIFSCQELAYLKLDGYKLSVPPTFCGFKSLLDLRLYHVRFESGALDSLTSGCPLLEDLTISYCYGFKCIDFSAPALKVLCIENEKVIKSICLKKAENLIDLTLMAHQDNNERNKVPILFEGLPKIQRLVLGAAYNKALSSCSTIPPTLQSSFSSLEYLKLKDVDLNKGRTLLFILNMLTAYASNLVELVIESHSHVGTQVPSDEFEGIWICLSQLQTVKIEVGDSFKNAMSLIRFILENSPSLETLTFDVGLGYRKSDIPVLLSISQDLLRMERKSQRAEVNLVHPEMWHGSGSTSS